MESLVGLIAQLSGNRQKSELLVKRGFLFPGVIFQFLDHQCLHLVFSLPDLYILYLKVMIKLASNGSTAQTAADSLDRRHCQIFRK